MTAFAAAGALLERAIRERVTPGAVIEVGRRGSVAWRAPFGALSYAADGAKTSADTIYDLASLTKVISTATIAMRLVERGAIAIDAIRPLLDHSSGLPAHVKLFQTARTREEFRSQILATPPDHPAGTRAVYSDLGFMLLGFLLEDAGGAPLDAQFAPIAQPLGEIGFNPAASLKPRIAPTELDPWRGREIRGEVHDENAYALGGVAGHAGLFGTAAAVGRFAQAILETFAGDTWLAKRSTLEEFVKRSSVPGSSRALGWDTMLPTSSCGTLMSPRAIGHTGFTGTSLWIDPEKDLYVALLTNRVHPTREGTGIQNLRRSVADAVVSSF
jgi:CubicO group peptidase (beta-lactamase class C family)